MNALRATLTFITDGQENTFTREVNLPLLPINDGIYLMAAQTFCEIEKEIWFADFYEQLSDPSTLSIYARRPITFESVMSGQMEADSNMQQVWYEITNTLFGARYLLAQSRGYKEVEQRLPNPRPGYPGSDILNMHISKMNSFEAAVYRLAKIEDLFLLLLFVSFGCSLVEVNMDEEDWQKRLSWKSVKEGLKRRTPAIVSNKYLNGLSDDDYKLIMTVFNKFKNPPEVNEILEYRHATTHRIPPAVDYHGFNGVLKFVKPEDRSGKPVSDLLTRTYKVDHEFLALYAKAVKVYEHYIQVLTQLKKVPQFA